MAMLDAVYVDTVEEKSVVAIRPKLAFRPIFEIATNRGGSGTALINETPPDPEGPEAEPLCFWWRRGREPVSEVKRLDESRKHWHQYFYCSRLSTKYCGYTSTADAFRRGKVFLRQARELNYTGNSSRLLRLVVTR